jgi:hypothetical protein
MMSRTMNFARSLNIMANPTLVYSIKGGEWNTIVGIRPRVELKSHLEKAIAGALGSPYTIHGHFQGARENSLQLEEKSSFASWH